MSAIMFEPCEIDSRRVERTSIFALVLGQVFRSRAACDDDVCRTCQHFEQRSQTLRVDRIGTFELSQRSENGTRRLFQRRAQNPESALIKATELGKRKRLEWFVFGHLLDERKARWILIELRSEPSAVRSEWKANVSAY